LSRVSRWVREQNPVIVFWNRKIPATSIESSSKVSRNSWK
jgi:hypothetical protein